MSRLKASAICAAADWQALAGKMEQGTIMISKEYEEYEKFIASLIRDVQDTGRKISDFGWGAKNKLVGVSGQEHQIDISFIDYDTSEPTLIIIECKCLNRRVNLEKVKVVKSTVDDLIANNDFPTCAKSIIVTTKGIQSGAKRFADFYSIDVCIVKHGPEFSFNYEKYYFEGLKFDTELGICIDADIISTCHSCGESFVRESEKRICPLCLELMDYGVFNLWGAG